METSLQPVKVVVFADFSCPYSFIAQTQIDRLMDDYDAKVLWRPHLLHPEVPPEGIPVTRTSDRESPSQKWLREMAPETAAKIKPLKKRQYTFLSFAGLEYAMDHGKLHEFRRAVFDTMWIEGGDIGEIETLQGCAQKAGLDAEDFAREVLEGPYVQRALEAVQSAIDLGVNQTPTIILGKTAILGWHYYEVYQTVLEKQGYFPKKAST